MAELKNCERCGEIFASIGDKDVCPKCGRQEEEDFQKVYRFLTNRKNSEATILEMVEATGVEEDLIIKFMKQNRPRETQNPNIDYGSESCRNKITSGKKCKSCSKKIKSQWSQHENAEQVKQAQSEKMTPSYYTTNKK